MKSWQLIVSLLTGVACLVLAILVVRQNQSNQSLQNTIQQQRDAINKGSMTVQVGQNILKDLAQLSVDDTRIKELLAKNGYTVNVNPTPTPTP